MSRTLRYAFAILVSVVVLGLSTRANAQTSATDSGTPAAWSKGAHPLGSYSATDVDTVNLFNGGVSMQFPLASLGGRAGMGAALTMSYNSKFWRSEDLGPDPLTGALHTWCATYADWDGAPSAAPGWRINAGILKIRQTGWMQQTVPGQCSFFVKSLTKVTFIAPDGTEYDFRDDNLDGYPASNGGCSDHFNRGTTWHTADGTQAAFVSDSAILDQTPSSLDANGYVILRDGTRFRIDHNYVTQVTDRNGNRVHYEYEAYYGQGSQPHTYEEFLSTPGAYYPNGRIVRIYDTLGRTISIAYRTGSDPADHFAWVSVKGIGGVTHQVQIKRALLSNALRSDQGSPTPIPTYQQLWGLDGCTNTGDFNPYVITAIVLPTGHSWQFQYNRFGEVARTVLPSGGSVTYEMAKGTGVVQGDVGPTMFRYCQQRSTHLNATGLAGAEIGSTRYEDPSRTATATGSTAQVSLVTVNEDRYDGQTRISRVVHTFSGGPLNSLKGYVGITSLQHTGYSPWMEGRETKTETKGYPGGVAKDRSTVTYAWEQRPFSSNEITNGSVWPWGAIGSTNVPLRDTRLRLQKTRLTEAPSPSPTSAVEYFYDDAAGFNNVSREQVFDYGAGNPGALIRQVDRTFVTSFSYVSASGAHLVSLPLTESVTGTAGLETTTTYAYDNYNDNASDSRHDPLVDRTFVDDLTTTFNETRVHNNNNFGTGYMTRGNVTDVTVGSNDPTVGSKTSYRYDIAGNVVATVSPRIDESMAVAARHVMTVRYDTLGHAYNDNYFAFATSTERSVTEADGTVPASPLSTLASYDFWTGAVLSATGYNTDETTTYLYETAAAGLDRLKRVTRPLGMGVTDYDYSGPGGNQYVTVTTDVEGAQRSTRTTTVDGLMRPYQTQATDPSGTGLVTMTTTYDGLGRAIYTSNPLGAAAADTDGGTGTTYDDLDRAIAVSTYAGRTVPGSTLTGTVTTAYAGPTVTVTDQSGHTRQSTTDALGRVVSVVEDSGAGHLNYLTTYGYDARGDLLKVFQQEQTRTFVYDALGRLRSAAMPEAGLPATLTMPATTGTTTYTYDLNSNLTVMTDPRSITTTSKYDEMDRVRSVNYSNTTVGTSASFDVSYFYDGSMPSSTETGSAGLPPSFNRGSALGRLVGVITNDAASQTGQERTGVFYGYDVGGRVVRTTSWTKSGATDVYDASTASYNLASQPVGMGYPSGNSVTMQHNAAGSLSLVTRTAGSTQTLASGLIYRPTGSLAQQTLGNGLVHTIAYNSRVQPTEIKLGTSAGASDRLRLEYDYGVWTPSTTTTATALPSQDQNNGNVGRIKITPGSGTAIEQYFSYDQLNRLALAREFTPSGGSTSAPPNAPTNLQASSPSYNQVILTWTAASGSPTGYKIERQEGGGSFVQVTTVGAVTSYTDNGRTSNTRYTYRVRATNGSGDSAYSNTATVTTGIGSAAGTPTIETATPSAQQVTLEWTAVVGATNYRIYVRTAGGTYPSTPWITVGGTTGVVSPLVNDTQYYFVVRSYNGSTESANSNEISAIPRNVVQPAAPTQTTAWAISGSRVNIVWRDNSTDETAFRIWRREGSVGDYRIVAEPGPDTQTWTDSYQMQPARTYTYYIQAMKNDVASAGKPTAVATTYAFGTSPAPAPLRAFAQTQARVSLNWTDVSGEAGYAVYRQTGDGFLLLLDTVGADVTTYIDTKFLSPDTEYSYIVRSFTAANVYSADATASASTYGVGVEVPGSDTIGTWVSSTSGFFLRNSNTTGFAEISFLYGPSMSTLVPLVGDWDGDGDDTAGLYNPATGVFQLKNTNGGGAADLTFQFGGGILTPIVGDWDGNGVDSVGLYDAGTATYYLKNANTNGAADATFAFGGGGIPIAGDWDGDGVDTIGFYVSATGNYYLRNTNDAGAADVTFQFGAGGTTPLAGDWDGDGVDTVGFYVSSTSTFFLRNANAQGNADVIVGYGSAGTTPLVGDWDDSVQKAATGVTETSGDGGDGEEVGLGAGEDSNKLAVSGIAWTEQYGYDPYGNLTISTGTTTGPAIVGRKNQFERQPVGGYNYDLAGNLTQAPAGSGVDTYEYDAKNMMWRATVASVQTTYVYDGLGRRVKKISGGVTTRFAYGATGEMVAEYQAGTLAKEYVYGAAGLLAMVDQSPSRITYPTADHLGTPRIVTSGTSGASTVLSRHDYAPFGRELFATTSTRTTAQGYPTAPATSQQNDDLRNQFTSKERDTETGLDYFGARYYGSVQGRFASPDPLVLSRKRQLNPQLWNSYSYVGNNPLSFVDPTGEELVRLGQNTDKQIDAAKKRIDEQIKDEKKKGTLTKERKSELEANKRTLDLEKQGNKAVGAMLKALDKVGEREGLEVQDFTLTTDTKADFGKDTTPDAMAQMLKDQAFVIQDSAKYSGTIYIRTEPSDGFYQLSQRNSDMVYYAASAVRHELDHLYGQRSEGPAYRTQDGIFHLFKNYFQNRELYDSLDKGLHESIKNNP